jgi:hypothetical protein
LRRCDRSAAARLLDGLIAEASSVLTEVHGSGWSPARWVPLIFPSSLPYAPEALSSRYLTPDTVWSHIQRAPAEWRAILERIIGLAASSPLGLRGLFTPSCLDHIDAFGVLFAPVPKRPPWLVLVVQRLRDLRAEIPLPSTVDGASGMGSGSTSASRPSQTLRVRRRRGPPVPVPLALVPSMVSPCGATSATVPLPAPPSDPLPAVTPTLSSGLSADVIPPDPPPPPPRKPKLTFSQRIARRFDELRARDIGFAFPLKPLSSSSP